MIPALPPELEDQVRQEAFKAYLAGAEEQALDLLAVAEAIAEPTVRRSSGWSRSPWN